MKNSPIKKAGLYWETPRRKSELTWCQPFSLPLLAPFALPMLLWDKLPFTRICSKLPQFRSQIATGIPNP